MCKVENSAGVDNLLSEDSWGSYVLCKIQDLLVSFLGLRDETPHYPGPMQGRCSNGWRL